MGKRIGLLLFVCGTVDYSLQLEEKRENRKAIKKGEGGEKMGRVIFADVC